MHISGISFHDDYDMYVLGRFISRVRFHESVQNIISSEYSPFILVVLRSDVYVFNAFSMTCLFSLPIFPNSGTFSHPVSLNSRWMAAPATTSTLKAMSGDRSEITGDYASRQAHGATKNIVSGLQSLKKSGKKYFREAAPELKHGVQDAANIASNMFSLAAGAVADFTTTVGGYMNAKPTEGSTQLSSTTSAADYLLHANKYSGSKEPSTEDDQKEVSGHQQKASRRSTLSSTRTHQNKQESCSSEEAGSPGFVIVVDLVTRSTVCLFRAHSTRVADTKFNNDGSLLATANERGQAIKIFSLTWPKQTVMSRDSSFIRTSKIRSQSEPFHSRHHSGDQGSMSALSGNVDKATNLKHNVSLLYILERGWTSVRILDIAFSPDSKLVVAVSSNGTCHCYRIEPNGGSLAVPMRFPSRQELCSALNTVDKVHGIARRPKENMDERISQLYTHSCNRIQSLSSSRISHRNADARIRLDLKGWKHEAKAKRRERERIQRCVVEQELAKRDAVYERQIKSNTMSGSSCEFSTLTYVADMEPYLRMDSTLNQVGADVRPQSLWLDDGGVADHEKPIYCDVMLICESSRPPPKLPPWGQRDDYVDEICRSLQSGYNEVNASDRKYKMLVGGPDGMAHVYSIDVTTGITEKAKQNALALLHPYFDNPAMDILDLSDESSPQEKLSVSGGEVTSAELLNKYESGRQSATGADILAQYSVPYNENKEIDISSVSLRASPKNGLSPKRGRSLSETLDRRSSSSTSGGDNQTSYTAWYSKLSSYLGQALSSASRFANISNPTDTCANLEEATGVHKYEGFPQALPHGIAVLLNVLRDSDCTACIQTSGMTVLDLRRKVSDEIQYFTEHTQEHRRDKTGNDICPPRLMLYSSEYTTSHSEAMCKWSRYSNDETHTLRILKENCNQFPTSEEDSSMVGSHPSDRNPPVSVSSTASGCVSITTRSSNNSPASDGLCSITEDVIMETGKSHNRDSWEDSYQTALTMDTVDDSPTVETSSRSSPVTSRDDSPNVFVGRSASASNASYDNKQGTGKSDPDFFSATEGSNRSSFDSTNQLDSAVTEVATSMNKDESVVVNSACTSEGQNETGDHESNHGGSQSSRKSRKKGKSKRSKKKR